MPEPMIPPGLNLSDCDKTTLRKLLAAAIAAIDAVEDHGFSPATLDQEGIAKKVFELSHPKRNYEWDDVDEPIRGYLLDVARFIMGYGLDCRRDELEKVGVGIKRAFEKARASV